MAYKITARVYQTNTNAFFHLVEQGVLAGGAWTKYKDEHIIEFISSGSSGTLRFVSDTGENFFVVLGVHNYKHWFDVVTDLANDQTGVTLNPEYYGSNRKRDGQYGASFSVKNTRGRQFSVNFTRVEGQDLACNIIVG